MKWKTAATTILFNKTLRTVLMMKRGETARFMPNLSVFPGGIIEQEADSSFPSEKTNFDRVRHQPFRSEQWKTEFALRVGAVRELFEETGILMVEDRYNREQLLLSTLVDKGLNEWRDQVRESPCKFGEMFTDFNLDVHRLLPWSNWLTPAVFPQRFDTYFFVVPVDDDIGVDMCNKEMSDYHWVQPSTVLAETAENADKSVVAPPQYYELARLRLTPNENLGDMCSARRLCPQIIHSKEDDNLVYGVLPGDHLYDTNDEENAPARTLSKDEMGDRPTLAIHRTSHKKMPHYGDCQVHIENLHYAKEKLQPTAMAAIENGIDDECEGLLEPKFNYERVLNDLLTVLTHDSASCLAVHDKFLAIGTQKGLIYIFDHDGNLHSSSRPHRCAVGGIAIDKLGNYVISCANDSQISVLGFGSGEYNQSVYLNCSAKCIAISEDYSRPGSGQRYVTGDTNLTLHEKGIIHKNKEKRLYQGFEKDGLISAVSWNTTFIAFSNDTGTRIYDLELEKVITVVRPLHDGQTMPSSKYKPNHCWLDSSTIAIGWANTVCICTLTTGPTKRFAISYRWDKLSLNIAGISCTLDEEYLWKDIVLLGIKANDEQSYPADDASSFCSSRLSTEGTLSEVLLQVLEPIKIDQYSLVTEDQIEMHGSSRLALTKFHMGALPMDSTFFLLASKELIRAMPSSVDDHIKWCLDNGLFEDAMYYARDHSSQLEEFSFLEIGKKYLDHLIELGKFNEAAIHMKEVCTTYKEEWCYYVNQFERHKKILLLAPYIPSSDPQLEPECYEFVLNAALFSSIRLFKYFITSWNADIYRVGAIIDMTFKRYNQFKGMPECKPLTKEDEAALLVSLAHLYTYDRKYDTALKLYMGLGDKAVFPLIDKFQLFPLVKDKIIDLMNIDQNKALRLLLENEDSMPSSDVMRQLSRDPKLQMLYLNRLIGRNEGAEFSDLAVSLYAEYDRSKLMPFLRKYEYRIDKALKICRAKHFYEEQAFLLGRSGKRLDAVKVMVEEMGRMDRAIDFCREFEDDTELWNYLIALALRNSEHITQLLTTTGISIDPLKIIEKIPPEMDIPGLRDSIVRILKDNDAQGKLQSDYKLVTMNDVFVLFDRYMSAVTATVSVSEYTECAICCLSPFDNVKQGTETSPLKAFDCGHITHKRCCDEFYADNTDINEAVMRVNRSLSFAGELAGGVCPICSNDVTVENG